MYYLSPELNTRPWTPTEDALLIEKYLMIGSRWVTIAKFFPNRTDAMIKNRFLMLQRKEKMRLRGFTNPTFQPAVPTPWTIAPANCPPPTLRAVSE
jgi:hypothetical protein